MFKKTLRKLTILNSGVFLFIFILFGYVLYGYVAHQLFDDVDDSLHRKAAAVNIIDGHPKLTMTQPPLLDPRVMIFLRDSDNRIIQYYPSLLEDTGDLTMVLLQAPINTFQTRKIDQHIYRLLSLPLPGENSRVIKADGSQTQFVQVIAVALVDSEVTMLKRLLTVIFASLIIGVLAIASAGYFLANRALIPIKASWDKQQQFVADASHELRTPITIIKSNVELLLRHPEHTIELEIIRITNVLREAIRMRNLVSTLLTLARSDANQLELQLMSINLGEVINEVVEQFAPLTEVKGVTLAAKVEDSIEIEADKERIHQLLAILLDNALKHTAQSGTILLTCRQNLNFVLIKVIDTGSGISQADLPQVFDRFFRGDKARSRENGGAGLGLSIAQWIVQQHGGKISIESELGMGTEVTVSLPVKGI
jgi:two-component system sensor histidine kinase CiaH